MQQGKMERPDDKMQNSENRMEKIKLIICKNSLLLSDSPENFLKYLQNRNIVTMNMATKTRPIRPTMRPYDD